MSNIIYKCDVTEFNVMPNKKNDNNVFYLTDESLVIELKQVEAVLEQTEISKEDSIILAKLILFHYDVK